MINYSENVQHGALLLDKKTPGWFNKINLDRFNCQNPQCCVLHYTFDTYFNGILTLGITPDINFRHGFSGEKHNEHWIEAIKARRQWQDYPGPIGYGITILDLPNPTWDLLVDG